MEIQWVIIAQSCTLNEDRTIDIGRISHHANIYGEYNKVSMQLIAKAHFSPIEVGENKIITLQVNHNKKGQIASYDKPYKIPDLVMWANRITYIALNVKELELPYSGEYKFSLFVDGEYKNEESIEVTDLMGGSNEKS